MRNFSTEDEAFKKIKKKLAGELDRKRFAHTMGVAYTAASLAMAHQEEIGDAYLAGLLHDNAKCIPADKKLKLCRKYHIEPNEAERENPDLLHAGLGALLAKDQYHVEDDRILDAIRYHTTGRPGMTELEKIIYIADYIEPNRKMLPALPKIRETAFRDLNGTMVLILQTTLQYLQKKGAVIDRLTQETYDYYQRQIINGEMTNKR